MAVDLKKVLDLHLKWEHGEADGKRANLAGANLARADLAGARRNGKTVAHFLQLGPMGSRQATLTVWLYTDGTLGCETGCFNDSLEVFEAAVAKTHGDNQHGKEYTAAIAFIRAWATTKENGNGS